MDADFARVVWAGVYRVEWRPTLSIRVVVIVTKVTCSVVEPTRRCVDEACWIELLHEIGQAELWKERVRYLAPSFVVDDLIYISNRESHHRFTLKRTQVMMLG